MKDLRREVAERLEKIFLKSHGSRSEIAKIICSTPQNLSGFFAGKQNLSVNQIYEIAKTKQVRAGWLAFGEEPKENLSPDEIAFVRQWETLDAQQRKTILEMVKAFQPKAAQTEEKFPPMREVVKHFASIDRRDEIAVYERSKNVKAKVPHWYGLAAGSGREMEKVDELYGFKRLERYANLCTAIIIGESMRETLLPNDEVILQSFSTGTELMPIGKHDPKHDLAHLRNTITHDSICVLAIDDPELATLKRVCYSGKGDTWHLQIAADNLNSDWGPPHVIGRHQHVWFYAKLVGLVKKAN
jgi:transcriptional regulator with XRE-family HTH domain